MANVLFILAKKGFRDPEFFIPKEMLEKGGHIIKVASNAEQLSVAEGAEGGKINIDFDIKNIDISEFDLVSFVGGPGCLTNLDNEHSYKIARDAIEKGRTLAAICISPVILAKAGVLKGVKATVWRSEFDKKPIEILKKSGAIFQEEPVVDAGNIVTADGPKAAYLFGKVLLSKLK